MPSLVLKPRVGCCYVEGRYFFLDIDRNRYCTLPIRLHDAIRNVIAGSDIDIDKSRELIKTGLFFSPKAIPMLATSDSMVSPRGSRVGRYKSTRRFQQLYLFTVATLLLGLFHVAVKAIPLKRSVAICKAIGRTSGREAQTDNLQMCLTAFRRAALLFVRKDQCLPDALALKAMLAFYGIPTKIVFGVRINPFQAHCWVQQDDFVLGQEISTVRSFHPILTLP
ncbi:lasso peptide biosynthesis B2 protein [Novosphingobium sp.]|jgi:hypothetical protein|uniref:lasso peptide biosynthesis B2 protein n=1 Tax=Novosphingobium sp. TaxID=1874826 RepID=UPI002FE41A5A